MNKGEIMANLDMKKTHKHLYAPSAKQISEVDVPAAHYLMIDGAGDPRSRPYQEAVQSLYPLAYGIRAICKTNGQQFTVMPLESLWWWEEMPDQVLAHLSQDDRDSFQWRAMIVQPDFVTTEMVETARELVREKKNPPQLDAIRFERFEEGPCAQIMHIGPYSAEGPTIQSLHEHITTQGYALAGKHHEIYLSDPSRVAPEKLKTIIRQPFAR